MKLLSWIRCSLADSHDWQKRVVYVDYETYSFPVTVGRCARCGEVAVDADRAFRRIGEEILREARCAG